MEHVMRVAAMLMVVLGFGLEENRQGPMFASGIIDTEFVFESAPFASAHASTIVETREGLVAAWFGGTREGAADVGIWLSRRVTGRWTPPIEVATGIQPDGVRHPCWNPVLFEGRDGTLMLFYKVGPSPQAWWGMLRTSRDGGRSWSEARRLPDGILGPIKNKPVQLADGTLIAGSSSETPERPSKWRVHFEQSRDAGLTWTTAVPAASADGSAIDAIQPSILVHPGGRLQAIGRSRSQRLFETWSDDRGRSWTPIALTVLPNPSSGTDAVTLRDGRHLIVYNHTAKGRSPLNVAVSGDGKQWDAALVLESEPGEYSYPAVIQGSDGRVHVTYTWKRQRVKHVVIDPARLNPVPMPGGTWPGDQVSDPARVVGRWDINIAAPGTNLPSWLEVKRSGNSTLVGRFVGIVGSARPISKIEFANNVLRFSIPPQWENGKNDLQLEGTLEGDRLTGSMTDPAGNRHTWTASRAPTLRRSSLPEWGSPVNLINGSDLAAWRPSANSQWRVMDQVLTNAKAGANLVTRDTFTDFKLRLEFRYPKGGNSGVYLRGRYEVQIEDTAGLEPASEHLGGIYGFLAPNENAARQAGEWQTFDITLVGRLVTVVLNGKTVIGNQEIPGITGGALDSDEGAPGPVMLQGDHGPIEFRNIILTPAK
jgi:predicted neuraminidase